MELRVNDTEGVTLCEGGFLGGRGGGFVVVSLRMNARVLSVLFQSVLTVEGSEGSLGGDDLLNSAPLLPGGGTKAPNSNTGGRFV